MSSIDMKLDVIFDQDLDIGKISELIGRAPTFTFIKGKTYHFKKEKIFDFSLCSFNFEGKSDSFSEFIVEKFSPIYKNLQNLAEFVQANAGEIELTVYFNKKSRSFDFSIYGEAKEILIKMNADVYFSY